MLQSAEAQREYAAAASAIGLDEEVLVSDARGDLTPAQMVQQKLMTLLWGDPTAVPVVGDVDDIRRARA
jgi:hypothetical protein